MELSDFRPKAFCWRSLLVPLSVLVCGAQRQCDAGGLIQLRRNGSALGSAALDALGVGGLGDLTPAPPIDPFACPTDNPTVEKCPENDWEIPQDSFNDGRCDCPDCQDEVNANFTCDLCGCPEYCTDVMDFCPGALPSTVSTLSPLCEKVTEITYGWIAEELVPCKSQLGFAIPPGFVNDGNCHCPNCEDEDNVTCNSCGKCPTVCGSYVVCEIADRVTETASEGCKLAMEFELGFYPPYFVCDNNWTVPLRWYNDSYCDCSQCEDEPRFSCDQCGGCPEKCGDYEGCFSQEFANKLSDDCSVAIPIFWLGISIDLDPSAVFKTCNTSNWTLPDYYWHDDYCDCPHCEDEDGRWDCDSCGGCPTKCFGSVSCWEEENKKACYQVYPPEVLMDLFDEVVPYFTCPSSGWTIPDPYVDDEYCDCPECEDEESWTCERCGACPLTCGASSVECGEPQPSCNIYSPCEEYDLDCDEEMPQTFYCASTPGFFIDELFFNDNICDCPLCEDEYNITCEQCGGCPVHCQDYVPCSLGYSPDLITYSTRDHYVIPKSWECTKASIRLSWNTRFYDFSECSIESGWDLPTDFVGDGWCDCPECEDELGRFTCESCGGCPTTCGDSFKCGDLFTPNTKLCPFITEADLRASEKDPFKCRSGWVLPGDKQGNGRCDCPDCDDEKDSPTNYTCETCGACPLVCGESVECGVKPKCPDWPVVEEGVFQCSTPGYTGIKADFVCQCPDCEDEPVRTCEQCGGCPAFCGHEIPCDYGFSFKFKGFGFPEESTTKKAITSTTVPTTTTTSTTSPTTSTTSTTAPTTTTTSTAPTTSTTSTTTTTTSTTTPTTTTTSTTAPTTSTTTTTTSTTAPTTTTTSTTAPTTSTTAPTTTTTSTTAPTTSTTAPTTTTRSTSSPSTGTVVARFTISNLTLQELESNETLLQEFIELMRDSVIAAAAEDGQNLRREDVVIELVAGSVIVVASISAPPSIAPALVSNLQDIVTQGLPSVISKNVTVSDLTVDAGSTSTSKRPSKPYPRRYHRRERRQHRRERIRKKIVERAGRKRTSLTQKTNETFQTVAQLLIPQHRGHRKKISVTDPKIPMFQKAPPISQITPTSALGNGSIGKGIKGIKGNGNISKATGFKGKGKGQSLLEVGAGALSISRSRTQLQSCFLGRRRRRRRRRAANPFNTVVQVTTDAVNQGLSEAERLAQQAAAAAAEEAARLEREAAEALKKAQEAAAELARKTVDEGLSFASGAVDDFINNAQDWSEAVAKAAVTVYRVSNLDDFVDGAVEITEDVIDGVQEAAEALGTLITSALGAGRDWFVNFLGEVLAKIVDAEEGVTNIATGIGSFPDDIGGDDLLGDLVTDLQDVLLGAFTDLAEDIASTGEQLGSALISFLGDEDMYAGLFGLLRGTVMNGLDEILTGQFSLQTAVNALNKIKKFMASYLKKALQPLQAAIAWLGRRMQAKVNELQNNLKTTIEGFIAGLAVNPQWKTWSVGVCAEGFLGIAWVSGCFLIPFTIGSDFTPENMVIEFSMGQVKQLRGATPTDKNTGVGAGVRFSAIVINDETALQGDAVGRGVEIDIEPPPGPYPSANIGIGWSAGTAGILTFDLAFMGFKEWGPPDDSLERISADRFTGYAHGWAPGSGQPPPLPNSGVGIAANQVSLTSAFLQATSVTEIHEHMDSNMRMAEVLQRNADNYLRTSASPVDANVRKKYGVFRAGTGCLPGAGIFSLEECKEAFRILKPSLPNADNSLSIARGAEWPGVPTGCSLQNQARLHFNAYARSNSARGVSGEFQLICRRLYRMGPKDSSYCPAGTGIVWSTECKDAFFELQGNFNSPPVGGFIAGSDFQPDVPDGCSVRTTPGNNHPAFRIPGATYTFVPGNFQILCKAARFWMESPGARSCPVGAEIDNADECQQAYDQMKYRFKYKALRVLQKGRWAAVPRGCSIQLNAGADQTPHFNSYELAQGTRALLGTATFGPLAGKTAEFVPLCKAPSFWRTRDGGTCPAGTRINGELACKAAYDSLRNTFAAKAKRLLVVDPNGWSHVPPGCVAPSGGEDSAPHVNKFERGHGTAGWVSLCWPGRYYVAPQFSRGCPTNQQITTVEECRSAYRALRPLLEAAGDFPMKSTRGVVAGQWPRIPQWCSVQTQVGGGDGAPHFNCDLTSDGGAGADEDRYRPICKILVPNVDPAPSGTCTTSG